MKASHAFWRLTLLSFLFSTGCSSPSSRSGMPPLSPASALYGKLKTTHARTHQCKKAPTRATLTLEKGRWINDSEARTIGKDARSLYRNICNNILHDQKPSQGTTCPVAGLNDGELTIQFQSDAGLIDSIRYSPGGCSIMASTQMGSFMAFGEGPTSSIASLRLIARAFGLKYNDIAPPSLRQVEHS